MRERVILSGRVAAEKGILPDEALTLGQVSGGDGIEVYQTDGRYIDENGLPSYDKYGCNNLVINNTKESLQLMYRGNGILESGESYYELETRFGALIQASHLVVNSVPYNQAWFNIYKGTDSFGNEKQAIIRWTGRFQLDENDSVFWEI